MIVSDTSVPAWQNEVCPIMSIALVEKRPKPKPTAAPAADTRQLIMPGIATTGGSPMVDPAAVQPTAAAPADDTEYVGCLGPHCALFVKAEGSCALNLIPRALGAMFALQASKMAPAAPTPTNGSGH